MNISSFAFKSEIIVLVVLKQAQSWWAIQGQMLKCHPWYVPQQEQVLLGLLVNGVGMLGGEEVAVYLRVQVPKTSGSAPAPRDLQSLPEAVSLHKVQLRNVIYLSALSANNSVENYVGICIHYKWEHNHSVQCWWARMSSSNEFVLCAWLWA